MKRRWPEPGDIIQIGGRKGEALFLVDQIDSFGHLFYGYVLEEADYGEIGVPMPMGTNARISFSSTFKSIVEEGGAG